MNSTDTCLDDLIVVDANSCDYKPLVYELGRQHVRINLYSTGEDALRASEASSSTVWIVNISLPDMSGINFLTLVRHRLRASRIFLISNAYSSEDELAARWAGATGYLCKPATAAWLEGCRPHCRSPAPRASPVP
jgi:DNA-binding response OmpR family regulator